jgi:hypothetical protein
MSRTMPKAEAARWVEAPDCGDVSRPSPAWSSIAGYLRPNPIAHQPNDLAGFGVPANRRLREDQLSVEDYLKPSLRRR